MSTATEAGMPHAERKVYIVDGSRTPFLKASGKPGPFSPVDLAVWAGRPLLQRQPFAAKEIDEVILGCVNPRADEINPGRVAGLRLGCGEQTPGWTVQRNCGSGMQSVDTAYRNIASGRMDMVLAGGTEALSHSPLLYPPEGVEWFGTWMRARSPWQKIKTLGQLRPNFFAPVVGLLKGLTDPNCQLNMGQTAEVLAHCFDVSREEADGYAIQSHKRLAQAQSAHRLREIEAIFDVDGNCYREDDGVRPSVNEKDLAKLKPAFEKPFGAVTAGNSSQITDGACWLLLASEESVERHQLTPLGRIVDCEWSALSPKVMGLGPVFSSTAILRRHALSKGDIDVWEINEAFSAQVLACLRAWQDEDFCRDFLQLDQAFGQITQDCLNIDGGAIALGHPVGTSGARIILHALHALHDKQGKKAIATQCIGGGQGGAMLLEPA